MRQSRLGLGACGSVPNTRVSVSNTLERVGADLKRCGFAPRGRIRGCISRSRAFWVCRTPATLPKHAVSGSQNTSVQENQTDCGARSRPASTPNPVFSNPAKSKNASFRGQLSLSRGPGCSGCAGHRRPCQNTPFQEAKTRRFRESNGLWGAVSSG